MVKNMRNKKIPTLIQLMKNTKVNKKRKLMNRMMQIKDLTIEEGKMFSEYDV